MLTPREAWTSPPRMLRQFAGLWLCLFGYLAYRQGIVLEQPFVGSILALIGVMVAVVGILLPGAIRPLFVGLLYLTFPLGWVISCLVLVIIYYGLFTPIGLIRRRLGADALHLRRKSDQSTYWVPRRQPESPESYLRQW